MVAKQNSMPFPILLTNKKGESKRLAQRGKKRNPKALFERYLVEKKHCCAPIIIMKKRNGEENHKQIGTSVTTQAWPEL